MRRMTGIGEKFSAVKPKVDGLKMKEEVEQEHTSRFEWKVVENDGSSGLFPSKR